MQVICPTVLLSYCTKCPIVLLYQLSYITHQSLHTSKEFCLYIHTTHILVSQARPFPFRSTDHFQCVAHGGKGLETNIRPFCVNLHSNFNRASNFIPDIHTKWNGKVLACETTHTHTHINIYMYIYPNDILYTEIKYHDIIRIPVAYATS